MYMLRETETVTDCKTLTDAEIDVTS